MMTKATKTPQYLYKGTAKQSKYASLRWVYLVLGFVFFILGFIGALLPVMPTAPFILLAAACWARGSERFYLWLINHKTMGKYVRDWEAHRAVPKAGKWLACLMMSISGTVMYFNMPAHLMWVVWVVVTIFVTVAIVLWRLPNA